MNHNPADILRATLAALKAENAALRQRVADLTYERDDALASLEHFRRKADHGCVNTFCPQCDIPRPKDQ